jgi:hypothetical protein
MSTPPPSPYAQQPHPAFPQQGYGGQPRYPQPGRPQPGYGQQPYPGQGGPGYGWGAPPPPPPKKNTGRIVAIVLGSVAGVLALVWFGNSGDSGGDSSSSDSSDSFPEAQYQLMLPQTLLDGKYKLAGDMSEKFQDNLAGMSESNIRDPQAAMAQYTSSSGAEVGVLVISGLHGRIQDPDEARSKMLKGAGDSDGSSIAVPAKDFTPAGSDVPVSCQVMVTEQTGGGKAVLPLCAWADDNTSATVTLVTQETAQSPEAVDLKAVAEATVKVREETRKPIG